VIPLSMAMQGEKVRIIRIAGGRGFVRRITEMGLYPGAEVEIVSNFEAGPLIIGLGGLRFGIGFGMAKRIFVEPLS